MLGKDRQSSAMLLFLQSSSSSFACPSICSDLAFPYPVSLYDCARCDYDGCDARVETETCGQKRRRTVCPRRVSATRQRTTGPRPLMMMMHRQVRHTDTALHGLWRVPILDFDDTLGGEAKYNLPSWQHRWAIVATFRCSKFSLYRSFPLFLSIQDGWCNGQCQEGPSKGKARRRGGG